MTRVISVPLIVLFCIGCGGSSGPNTILDQRTMSITWPERTRAVLNAPTSALSARITLLEAGASGQDVVFVQNRQNRDDSYIATYTVPEKIRSTTRSVTVDFFAQPDAAGDLVATATARVDARTDPVFLTNVVLGGRIASVLVSPRTMLTTDGAAQLQFTAQDGQAQTVAVSPGSAKWTLVSGTSIAITPGGMATPSAAGVSSVRATVDGISSPNANITVQEPTQQ